MNNFYYKTCGLTIKTPFHFPELQQIESTNHDINIVHNRIPDNIKIQLSKFRCYGSKYEIVSDLGSQGRYLISNGNEIIIDENYVLPETIQRFVLLGSCLGTCLMQRHILPLHASSVVINNQVVLFSGPTKAGKSTLASYLNQHGFPLYSEDLSPIYMNDKNISLAKGISRVKLWQDSLIALGNNPDKHQIVHPIFKKYAYFLNNDSLPNKLPVKALFILENSDEVSVEEINSIGEKMATIFNNIYYVKRFYAFGFQKEIFDISRNLVNNIPIYRLKRPLNYDYLPNVRDTILQTIS